MKTEEIIESAPTEKLRGLFEYFRKHGPLSENTANEISKSCRITRVKKGIHFQPIGNRCRQVYFVNSGLVRIYYFNHEEEITEGFAFENNLIARADSLFTGNPSTRGLEAMENSELIVISADDFKNLYSNYPETERICRKIMENLYLDSVNRIESLKIYSSEERYHMFRQQYPELIKRIQLRYIASYLGMSQVTISRIRSNT